MSEDYRKFLDNTRALQVLTNSLLMRAKASFHEEFSYPDGMVPSERFMRRLKRKFKILDSLLQASQEVLLILGLLEHNAQGHIPADLGFKEALMNRYNVYIQYVCSVNALNDPNHREGMDQLYQIASNLKGQLVES